MSTGEIVLAVGWSMFFLAIQVWRLSSLMIALHGRERARTAQLGWLWSLSRSKAPARRRYLISGAAVMPLFPLVFVGFTTGIAQLISMAGAALSVLVSILSLAADGDLRERAGSGNEDELPGDIGGH
jgi:hypothetical protein